MKITITKITAIVALSIAVAACGSSDPNDAQPIQDPALMNVEFSYDDYDALLHEYVDKNGMVDYGALLDDRFRLDAFVASMNNIPPEESDAWNRQEKMAFWINAYNAITIKYILDNYPIQKGSIVNRTLYPDNSIRQIDGIWKKLTSPVLGTPITLNDIEHEILRPVFNDPRIHVAIVCASIGCPPLRSEVFLPDQLEEQLEDHTRIFLSDPDKFRIDKTKNKVYISPIFDWFGEDFTDGYNKDGAITKFSKEENAVLDFISNYIDSDSAAYLQGQSYSVSYSDYDWSLNEQ